MNSCRFYEESGQAIIQLFADCKSAKHSCQDRSLLTELINLISFWYQINLFHVEEMEK